MNKLGTDFFSQDVLEIAPVLIGKDLCVIVNNTLVRHSITEVEAYRGEEDLACHASKGRTIRNSIMYGSGGYVYVYLIYGMYWMLNFVTGKENDPQAVLIRGITGHKGPGIITRELKIDKSFYGENLETSKRIWVEDTGKSFEIKTGKRIGIDYSGEIWKNKLWRYYI